MQNLNLGKWFLMRTFDGQEERRIKDLKAMLEIYGLSDKLIETFIPKEQTLNITGDQVQQEARNFYPGYIFICFDVQDAEEIHDVASFFVKNKANNTLIEMMQSEIDAMKSLQNEFLEKPTTAMDIKEGSHIIVIDGPYQNLSGTVDKINLETKKVTVNFSIFGQSTQLTLDLSQIKRHNI